MDMRRRGVDFLLMGEAFLLVVVLVLGLLFGASGLIRGGDTPEDTIHSDENGETDGENGQDDDSNQKEEYLISEDYAEERIVFSQPVEDLLASMTIEQKVAQLFLVSPEALTGYDRVTVFGDASRTALNTYPVGGLVYSNLNFQNQGQAANLVTNARQFYTEEYGYSLFAIYEDDNGEEFLPITAAGEYDWSAITGNEEVPYENIGASLRFFPGKDALEINGNGICYSEVSLEELWSGTLASYRDAVALGAPFAMIGNVIYPCITDDENVPCTLSWRTVALLRENMGFQGVIVSDDFSEEAFVALYGNGAACVEAIKAGVDMIYMPADFAEAYQAVLDAVNSGNISADRLDNAVGRILTAKGL